QCFLQLHPRLLQRQFRWHQRHGAGGGPLGRRRPPLAAPDGVLLPGGSNHFNDKPMITVDQGAASPFRDHVYVAWDAAFGGSSAGGIRVAHSADHGASFVTNRADNPSGPGRSIGAVPFVGPDGTLAVAWNDFA